DHGLIVAGSGESMACRLRYRGAVRSLDSGDFPKQLPVIFIHHHHPVLAGNEQTMIRRIRYDVVPASVTAERKGVRDPVGPRRLRGQDSYRGHRRNKRDPAHMDSFLRTPHDSRHTSSMIVGVNSENSLKKMRSAAAGAAYFVMT